jgi:Flp pilus assembly protein TadG
MLEMLIVLPVLILMIFSMIEFAVMLSRWTVVSNAAREGARQSIVFRTNCVAADVESDVETTVQSRAAAFGLSVAPADISVTGACAGAGTNSFVTVDLAHNFVMLPGVSINLTGGSVMRNEGG